MDLPPTDIPPTNISNVKWCLLIRLIVYKQAPLGSPIPVASSHRRSLHRAALTALTAAPRRRSAADAPTLVYRERSSR